MSNYYQAYYQGHFDKNKPGETVRRTVKEQSPYMRDTTQAQEKYRKDMVEFLKSKGFEWPRLYMAPKNCKECSQKIRTMITILKKNGWDDEFYSREYEGRP